MVSLRELNRKEEKDRVKNERSGVRKIRERESYYRQCYSHYQIMENEAVVRINLNVVYEITYFFAHSSFKPYK